MPYEHWSDGAIDVTNFNKCNTFMIGPSTWEVHWILQDMNDLFLPACKCYHV